MKIADPSCRECFGSGRRMSWVDVTSHGDTESVFTTAGMVDCECFSFVPDRNCPICAGSGRMGPPDEQCICVNLDHSIAVEQIYRAYSQKGES